MAETDSEMTPVEPVTAGKVGARRAEIGQQLPDSVSGSLNVPQVRPAAATRPEAATPSTADPGDVDWPRAQPPRRPDVADDRPEGAERMDAAHPYTQAGEPPPPALSALSDALAATPAEVSPHRGGHRLATATAVAAGLLAIRTLIGRRRT
ncbi:hypothetical protein Acor_07700 [Acrocarpospora corrugata]|uniref:Uncharacterized protein n=1 Tax=Acrocarpospora corrugata TaxID=35763 RepID=A0A5M3VWD1_9ACTN|nr:hypothetical protein [Acrocarpospora corrugata]GER98707.1 hypothetical protein Acor_07700 [Acrocarpospora corrugata]